MTNTTLAHLYALRAHIEAVILVVEAEVGASPQPEPGGCPSCGASSEYIQDRSTLDGTKRDRCTRCGHEWERFPAP